MTATFENANKHTIGILVSLAVLSATAAHAQFHFGEPENLGPVVNSEYGEGDPEISFDGLTLYFHSERPGGEGSWDLWTTTRLSQSEPWQVPVNLGPTLNTAYYEFSADISTDGLTLYFSSNRPGGEGLPDIWMTTRDSVVEPWNAPVNFGQAVNTSVWEWSPEISADGLTLLFTGGQNRPGGLGLADLWMTTRVRVGDPWTDAVNLGPPVNSPYQDTSPGISIDGLVLFFSSDRPGGEGDKDIWMTTRANVEDPWGSAVVLPPPINTAFEDSTPNIAPDGRTLYFRSTRSGGYGTWDLYQVAVFPCHGDLNRDGEVGLSDLTILLANFGIPSGMSYGDGDLDGDGDVDLADLAQFLPRFGASCL